MSGPLRTREVSTGEDLGVLLGTSGQWTGYSAQHKTNADAHRFFGKSICVDETHKGSPGKWREGGNLLVSSFRQYGSCQETMVIYYNRTTHQPMYWYGGQFRPLWLGYTHPLPGLSVPPEDFLNLGAYGATAWNQFKPGKPTVDLGVALVELRDLPSLYRTKLRAFRDLGRNYLNYEFGWKPFLSDIRRFVKTTMDIKNKLTMLRNNNGKWVLRKGLVHQEKEVLETFGSDASSWPFYPTPNSYLLLGGNHHSVKGSQYMETKIWFSGRFRYYIPNIDSVLDTSPLNPLVRRLYGLTITPSLLWELTPWSWLVDWCSNVGDVIANLSDADIGLVAKYAYVMGTWTHAADLTNTGYFYDGSQYTAYVHREQTLKRRSEAHPFGFGLSDGDLSARQWAILFALGLR